MRYLNARVPAVGEDRKVYSTVDSSASAGQTIFNVSYDQGRVAVFLNGIRLVPVQDYTYTLSGIGSNITLASGIVANDYLELIGLQGINAGNAVTEDNFVVGTSSTGSGGGYTNSTTVFPVSSSTGDLVSVWRNGIKLVPTTDFTVNASASTVTLQSASNTADEITVHVVGILNHSNFVKSTGGTFTGTVAHTGDTTFGDNNKSIYGAGSDLQIYHDGSNSIIKDTGTGDLIIGGDNNVTIANSALTEVKALFTTDGASSLYYDNSSKIQTTATGINVAGNATVTGDLTVSGTTTTVDTTVTISDAMVVNNAGSDVGLKINSTSTGHIMQLQDNGTDVMVVKDGGNIGIGNNSPDVLLDVGDSSNGSGGVAGRQVLISDTVATVYAPTNPGTWGSGIKINNADATSNRTSTGITFEHRTSSSGLAGIFSTSSSADRADLRFITRGSSGIGQRMIIDDSGKVGIGTAAPTEFLHLHDGGGSTAPAIEFTNSANSRGLEIRSTFSGDYHSFKSIGGTSAGFKFETDGGSTYLHINHQGKISTGTGSQLSSVAGTTYTLYSSDSERSLNTNNVTWVTMRKVAMNRSGSVRFTFDGYIQSGGYWWSYNFKINDVRGTTYFYTQNRTTSNGVHSYNSYSVDVNVNHGDIIVLEFTSAQSGGTPHVGNGQLIYIKNFRIKATTPESIVGLV